MFVPKVNNGKLIVTPNHKVASDCGGTVAVCNVFPQYITAASSGITIGSVGYYINSAWLHPYDTNSSLYNNTFVLPFYSNASSVCDYRLTTNAYTYEAVRHSSCGTETNVTISPILTQIRFNYSTRNIIMHIRNTSDHTLYGGAEAFYKNITLSSGDWNTMISNRTITLYNDITSLSTNTRCSILHYNPGYVGYGGEVVLSW